MLTQKFSKKEIVFSALYLLTSEFEFLTTAQNSHLPKKMQNLMLIYTCSRLSISLAIVTRTGHELEKVKWYY